MASSGELSRKLQNSLMENSILAKQIDQWKREHGELILREKSASLELYEAREECERLKQRLGEGQASMAEFQVLKREKEALEARLAMASKEINILKKQKAETEREYGDLLARKSVMEAEAREGGRREKEMEERLKRVEMEMRERGEREKKLEEKNRRLERDYDTVIMAATQKFKELEKRVTHLEKEVEDLSGGSPDLAPEAAVSDAKTEELGNKSDPEATPLEEKMVSVQCIDKSASAPPPIFISDSDDDDGDDLPPSKGIKRKSFASGDSDEREKDGVSFEENTSKQLKGTASAITNLGSDQACPRLTSSPKQNSVALKQCQNKLEPGVDMNGKNHGLATRSDCESIGSNKEWEYEADMLDALEKDAELCMKGICALYRQHTFNPSYALRGIQFAKFLVDGDPSRIMRRSVADLEKFDPNGTVECRRIAFVHAKQLFDMYKKKRDPYFGP